jgi:hypothetical protein
MESALKVLMFFVRSFIFEKLTGRLKQTGTLVYLKLLQGVRRSLIALIGIFVLLQLMVMGFVGALVCGIALLPTEQTTKIWIFFSVFSLLFLLPLAFLAYAFSDRAWFRYSGASELMNPPDRE